MRAAVSKPRLLTHLGLPAVALALASTLLMSGGDDQWIADRIFALEGGHRALRDAWLTDLVIHTWGKRLTALAWLLALAGFAATWTRHLDRTWRRPLGCLVLSVPLGMLLVSAAKQASGMDCQWDLVRYGGDHPFIGLLAARPAALGHAACFPAGHASAGYAWVALYFCLRSVRPTWRFAGLAAGLLLGATFGLAQQLRGAHFLSHDLWSLALCWATAFAVYALLLQPRQTRSHRSSSATSKLAPQP